MSSTILHESGLTRDAHLQDDSGVDAANGAEKNPFLVALGERVRDLRARRGLTRKAAAQAAGVSERHLANLEYGSGNASILVLQHIADALQCSLAGLLGDVTTSSPEWILLRELLEHRDEATLRRVRIAVGEMLGTGGENAVQAARSPRVALIGLRGAGKTTLGGMLAEDLDFPFVELSREIEKFAGCSIAEIQGLYGMNAYRRYERRAVEEAIQIYPEAVIATPGGLVSDPATFNLLLAHCTTVWLQADAQDHMERVRAQGDFRPMAASKEAMEDLRHILAGRAAFYSKAEFSLDTSAQPLEPTFAALRELVRTALQMPG
ncbi:helix-turn-helix transcriptional regulator [Cupriavidus oxalaticus]|uniref:Shikimate kinase n=1 Tax=Cupriavidus oxalaticus TaxID=96344 RepID=A0A375GJY8_9BURK|nr:helix-turn-helix transcriptional regulator [Cupriavidus oxalaticus]QEZ43521.1 helix-turn-helix domain-containing protein [Cupriavidus oxalaticus]QRQ85084.1 helix-turn-helix transcriptional regulator [Cupriavidus oxalaticus]QRQ90828.1 helix-turn-helix transcriptional regulator [Cupriavidus oxalaticus]WQD85356.1 helix-turn-helix transcriptional regulator [Cupriavidus oxalaticus]SPC23268.1 Shikimate kinase [Cupriavidus oxalaticus]